ncbi:MAG TPA: acetyl-CoA carboxylase biotin carboxyl carrier protein [Candidatus Limnocylindria bacterium]|nr:acetyl-CoA carboxylase biotin carboxyl carrier protein [Candidatus Limnocylindria bacterium]
MPDPKKVRAEANALVQELLSRLEGSDVRELEVTRGGVRVRVAKTGPVQAAAPVAPAPGAAQPATARQAAGPSVVSAAPSAANADVIAAPLTGVFYRSPSPQTPAFVQVGSVVAAGDVIGLIEAMKLFNEIRSTKNGTVQKILAENGQLVRAHAPLIELDPA